MSLEKAGVKIIGTSPDSIDLAEDANVSRSCSKNETDPAVQRDGNSVAESKKVAEEIGYPVVVRPSYVLGGRAMQIVYDEESLDDLQNGRWRPLRNTDPHR